MLGEKNCPKCGGDTVVDEVIETYAVVDDLGMGDATYLIIECTRCGFLERKFHRFQPS